MLTEQQYTSLVKKYIDMVFRLAYQYTNHFADAEDITQNAFLALLQARNDFEDEDHIRFWLIRVTVNECKKWHRSPWRRHVSYEDMSSNLVQISQEDRIVMDAVMRLPRKYRVALYLYYYEGYSTQEIADILKIPKGTVCTNLSRGRELLRKQFLEEGDFDE